MENVLEMYAKKLQDAVEAAADGGKVVGLFEDGAGDINVVSNREDSWKKTTILIGYMSGVDKEALRVFHADTIAKCNLEMDDKVKELLSQHGMLIIEEDYVPEMLGMFTPWGWFDPDFEDCEYEEDEIHDVELWRSTLYDWGAIRDLDTIRALDAIRNEDNWPLEKALNNLFDEEKQYYEEAIKVMRELHLDECKREIISQEDLARLVAEEGFEEI